MEILKEFITTSKNTYQKQYLFLTKVLERVDHTVLTPDEFKSIMNIEMLIREASQCINILEFYDIMRKEEKEKQILAEKLKIEEEKLSNDVKIQKSIKKKLKIEESDEKIEEIKEESNSKNLDLKPLKFDGCQIIDPNPQFKVKIEETVGVSESSLKVKIMNNQDVKLKPGAQVALKKISFEEQIRKLKRSRRMTFGNSQSNDFKVTNKGISKLKKKEKTRYMKKGIKKRLNFLEREKRVCRWILEEMERKKKVGLRPKIAIREIQNFASIAIASEEKDNGFKASEAWVFNFLRRNSDVAYHLKNCLDYFDNCECVFSRLEKRDK